MAESISRQRRAVILPSVCGPLFRTGIHGERGVHRYRICASDRISKRRPEDSDETAACRTVTCPSCTLVMTPVTLEGHSGMSIVVDSCRACRVFWFDIDESLSLSPASTLRLFTHIGDASTGGQASIGPILRCPRCRSRLLPTHDRQRDTRFEYWRCDRRHGRLTTFFNFLREKNFIRTLSPPQLAELRLNIQFVNCSSCGGPIDLTHASACPHCGAPISMLDMQQAGRLVTELREASTPRPVDPALPIDLIRARREVDAAFATLDQGQEWWRGASSSGLVEAGVAAIARWLKRDR